MKESFSSQTKYYHFYSSIFFLILKQKISSIYYELKFVQNKQSLKLFGNK